MNLFDIVKFFGGLGLFLYGMTTMGNALERLAGARLERTLQKVTGNLGKAVLTGALITGVIQSSSATTVMVVGFVNAGLMTLLQAAGVIMGANIGTTVTAQILRFDNGGAISENVLFSLINPSNLCYILIFVGLVIMMATKKKSSRSTGEMLVGLGVLFVGMGLMESSVAVLQTLPAFQKVFVMLENPILGVLAGAIITGIIQSSSASVGILQAAAATGAVTYSAAIPIIMGQNIGTCVTALISSIGANKNAKRAAMIHFYFNLLGTIIFMSLIYAANAVFGFSFWGETIGKGGIANFHTMFNVATTLLFLPFSKLLVRMAEKTIKAKQEPAEQDFSMLDERFYATPSVALEQCSTVAGTMGEMCLCNFLMANDAIIDKKPMNTEIFLQSEEYIDKCEARLNSYMIKIKYSSLPDAGKLTYTEIMHVVGDFERIGDYSENLLDQYKLMQEKEIIFSPKALSELIVMRDATEEIINMTNQAYAKRDSSLMVQIEALEEIIDSLKETLKNRHISRLQSGDCTVTVGIPFLDIIHNYEKISDHCANISVYIAMTCEGDSNFDIHEYRKQASKSQVAEYQRWIGVYEQKYLAIV